MVQKPYTFSILYSQKHWMELFFLTECIRIMLPVRLLHIWTYAYKASTITEG